MGVDPDMHQDDGDGCSFFQDFEKYGITNEQGLGLVDWILDRVDNDSVDA